MDASANTISGGVKNDLYGNRLFCNRNSSVILGVFIMKIGDRCFVHGYVDEIRKDVVIIKNKGGYFGTDPGEVITVTNTAHPNWIPCSERLPEEDTEVLISYRYKEGEGDTDHVNIDITSYGTVCFGGREIHTLKEWRQPFDYFHANYEVIAWMPLPEPYKEVE